MTLTLMAVSLDEQVLSQPITAVFDRSGGTIGRADHNTLALPDPQRHISRHQAEVFLSGSAYMIRNVGAANPILVGGRALAQGEAATLSPSEPVRIGGYMLKVQLQDEESTRPSLAQPDPFDASRAALSVGSAEPPLSSANPFAELLGGAAAASSPNGNPFADLLGSPPPAGDARARSVGEDRRAGAAHPHPSARPFADAMPPPAGVDVRSVAVAPPSPPPRLPDDFDPFASLPSPRLPTPPAPAPVDPIAGLIESPRPSIDQLFNLNADDGRDPLAGFMANAGEGARPDAGAAAVGVSTDPLALFGGSANAPAPAIPAQRDDLPAIHAAFELPRAPTPAAAPELSLAANRAPVPPATSAASPAPHPPASTAGSSLAATDSPATLWAAFCDGAGVELPLPEAAAEAAAERMRTIGRILRSAVEGTLRLMAVRNSTRQEMSAAVTVIRARENNPLKFSPDARSGLEQLLQPPLRGFVDGPSAMDNAMHDLLAHSIGTVAGMRAALEGLLERYEPTALEAKLSRGSMLDSLLPMNRKARLWDLYLQHHRHIRDDAQDDFQTLFGKAFLAAYEQQVERLESEAAPR